ncbi:hypothetical protein FN846DRAFT_390752 [Sphaerosporella brunnea]|uniref:Uncharacterized protein n=1 Tax=Sphaerosporella brunnea TaxID=1250544 RepID=A0A5J5F4Y5_9PEZI|nr:hypothetical protein FN846DRAFT_390752 [Sphaerosporella brunnea]
MPSILPPRDIAEARGAAFENGEGKARLDETIAESEVLKREVEDQRTMLKELLKKLREVKETTIAPASTGSTAAGAGPRSPVLRRPLPRDFISSRFRSARDSLPPKDPPTLGLPSQLRQRKGTAPSGRFLSKLKGKHGGGYNPATFYIWIFLLIRSQAIQQILLKHEHADFVRKAGNKIVVFREVIERLGRGEDVDVEATLGTGDEKEEKDSEQVLKELEEDDVLWQARKLQKEAAAKRAEQERLDAQEAAAEKAAAQEAQRKKKRQAAAKEARFL